MDVKQLMLKYVSLPPVLKNTMPWGYTKQWVYWIWDRVLPALGLCWVSVTKPDDYDHVYYRFRFWTPFRTHCVNFTPKSIDGVYQMATALRTSVYYRQVEALMNHNEWEGSWYIPKWAIDRWLALAARVVVAEQTTIQQALKDANEVFNKDKPTLH